MNKFKFQTIVKDGDEHIVFQVLEDCNLNSFLLLDNTYDSDARESNVNRHCYKFPNVNVKRGDFIILYTGTGEDSSYSNKVRTTTYTFYWGFDGSSIWNDESDHAILVEIAGVQFFNV